MCKITVYTNAEIFTQDPLNPRVNSLAVACNEIIDAGESLENKYLGAKIVDLNGATVIPGFIDTHLHLKWLALQKQWINLSGTRSIEELLSKLREAKTPWVIGRGFNEKLFPEEKTLTRHELDEAFPEKPVLIVRVCGHIGVANTQLLKKVGLWDNPEVVEGVEIDSNGKPTGVLKEKALEFVLEKIPKPPLKQYIEFMENVLNELLSKGLTTVVSMNTDPLEFYVLQSIDTPLKVRVFFDVKYLETLSKLMIKGSFGNEKLKVKGVKIIGDGSFGGRTAALRHNYVGTESKGELLITSNAMENIVSEAKKLEMLVAVHAIGDRAIEEILNVKETLLGNIRIEHCSLTPPDIVEKLSEKRVFALSVQPHFRVSDTWLPKVIGESSKYAYMFYTLSKRGLLVSFSSDAPVEPFDPLVNLEAAISDEGVGERVPISEALKMYTKNGSLALNEKDKGVLKKGYKADFVILSRNIFREKPSEAKVIATIIEGKIAYGKIS